MRIRITADCIKVLDRPAQTLQARLHAAGIGTLIHYPIPPHRFRPARCRSRDLAAEVQSLPIGPHFPRQAAERVALAIAGRG